MITLQITFLIMMKAISHQGNSFGVSSLLIIKSLLESLFIILFKRETSRKWFKKAKLKIFEDIMNQMNKKHFSSKLKGRTLSMLVASREVYKLKRKRKSEQNLFEVRMK